MVRRSKCEGKGRKGTRPSALTTPSCQSPPARDCLSRVSANGPRLAPLGFFPDSVLTYPTIFSLSHKTHSDPRGPMSPTVFLSSHGREETRGGWVPGIAMQKGYDTLPGLEGKGSPCSSLALPVAESKAAEGRRRLTCQGKDDGGRMERPQVTSHPVKTQRDGCSFLLSPSVLGPQSVGRGLLHSGESSLLRSTLLGTSS